MLTTGKVLSRVFRRSRYLPVRIPASADLDPPVVNKLQFFKRNSSGLCTSLVYDRYGDPEKVVEQKEEAIPKPTGKQICMRGNEIDSTECECPRGDFKCSHAAALFIHAIHNLSRTDVECSWKRKQLVDDGSSSVGQLYPPPKKTYKPLKDEVTDDDRRWFVDELKNYGKFTGMAWILSPEPSKHSLPVPTIDEIISSKEFIEQDSQESYLLQQLQVTEDKIKLVSSITKGQRDNPTWLMTRKGRLTASNFGCVLNAKKVTPSLLKRVLGEYNLSGVQSINWGINNESQAVEIFQLSTNLVVEKSGLWLEPSGILGASPDGLIGSDSLLEVKCPFSVRECTIAEAIEKKNFFLEINDQGLYILKKSHDYWHQIQGQLYITRRKRCYLVVWTLKESVILSIDKDETWEGNIKLLEEFYKKHLLKKIIEGM